MQRIRSNTHACLLITTVFLAANAASSADDAVVQLAVQATREYDILAPSLRGAAQELIEDIDTFHNAHKPLPDVHWESEPRKLELFLTPRNRQVALHTEVVYTVSVRLCAYQYRVKDVERVFRTGVRRAPFAGSVEIDVVTTTRAAETELTENLEIPNGYRPFKPPKGSTVFLGASEEEFGVSEALGASGPHLPKPTFPLPHVQKPVEATTDLTPTTVSESIDKLHKLCGNAQPVTSRGPHVVHFEYLIEDHKWHWYSRDDKHLR